MDATQGHQMGDSFQHEGRWCTPCECGRRFTSDTEAKAAARQRSHARQSVPTQTPAPVEARVKKCGCGCDGQLAQRAGGLFLSGHDARFKSILTRAHAESTLVRHPQTEADTSALEVADWLDSRRGGGDFWRSKVLAGHKPTPAPRTARTTPVARAQDSVSRVDRLMESIANRRPVSGDVGVVHLRDGNFDAKVLRRNSEDSLAIRITSGPKMNVELIVTDEKFEKKTLAGV